MTRFLFVTLIAVSIFVSPAIALFMGIAFALFFEVPFPQFSKKMSKYLLQASVVGLGFGMNLQDSLQSSKDGMLMTIVSVTGVMAGGYLLGRIMRIDRKLTHLISAGTAICGGSAIAAISPVVKANQSQTSMSLAVVFTLNALALFIFPAIGHVLDMSQQQFGLWAAIAIHDTSSVVGAGAAYGPEALMVATTVKLTRALWIIPLAIVSTFFFRDRNGTKQRISIPWFILLFVVAMIINTYIEIPRIILQSISEISHRALSVTLLMIGTGLSLHAIREVGARPVILGITLWIVISIASLALIML